ncbi:uncharacterized protein BX664DRAFT_325563 [Halteromyces radiatus]|uniref:uncharacterized protein n=1 Tax=Halteromyces radiatus TaxID=101107 RepID=UPI002220E970|nr:uncharacterized protein BX664DRAFT_325563 [Halteromyces radiatus]KAI8097094.1 hypothetical protein BX664DRAFT_325563 [Halteromyces radiatus]
MENTSTESISKNTSISNQNLPSNFNSRTDLQKEFFEKYGAINVQPIEIKDKNGYTFLDFETRQLAEDAYQRLDGHRIDSTHSGLRVEYAKKNQTDYNSNMANATMNTKLISGKNAVPIASDLGLKYPSNPHLQYQYPTPTPEILGNMMNAIATVPRLYTQVLHLMNKMNLPPPFGPANQAATPSILKRKRDELLASDESEIELDNDDEQEQKLRLRRLNSQQQRKILRNV